MRAKQAKPAGWQRFGLWALLALLGLFIFAPGQAVKAQVPDPVINEFVVDHLGTDTNEFVEIYGAPNTDYSNFWILEIEGDSGGSTGQIDDGIFQVGTTDANGIWTTGYDPGGANDMENGNLTLLLVESFSGATGNDIDTNDDGVIDATFWVRLVDSVGVSEENGGQVYGQANLLPGYDGDPFQPGGASRYPDGIDTDTPADWYRNNYAGDGLPCCSGTTAPGEAFNTAGLPNAIQPILPVINEFVVDHTGADVNEFVEIYGSPNSDYSNYWIVEIEGDSGSTGLIDDGVFQVGTTDANGIWVTPYQNNLIENGTITLLLVDTYTGSTNTDIDTNDDGVIDAPQWTNLVDGVGVPDGGASDLTYGDVDLGPNYDGDSNQPGGASRIPDGVDTNTTADWIRNDYDGDGLPCWPNCNTPPAGPADPGEAINTPGGLNQVQPNTPVINEFVVDHTGSSDENEFVEIYGDPNTDYSAYTIVEIEGDSGATGLIDDGVFTVGTTDANGIWATPYQANLIENGTITLLLTRNYTGTTALDIDTNDDGIIDVPAWAAIVDGVGVPDGGAGDLTYGDVDLAPNYDGNSFQPGGASRIPDGVDTDTTADWIRNTFDGEGLACFPTCGGGSNPPGSPGEAFNTPGALNAVILGGSTDLVINEIDYDQPSADTAEFIEILNVSANPIDLSAYWLELVNGDLGGAVVYDTITLPAVNLAAGDYYVVCADMLTVTNCDLEALTSIQNGAPDAVAIMTTVIPNLGPGIPVVVDTVSYEGDSGAPYTEGSGTGLLDDSANAYYGISRFPNGIDTQSNNVDLSGHCITPGVANSSANTNCAIPPGTIGLCFDPATFIHDVQGNGGASPLDGVVGVVVEGIVVGDFQNTSNQLSGFFVQEEDGEADADPMTSEGLFVYDNGFGPDVIVGDVVRVQGTVDEFNGLTELTSVTSLQICASGQTATPVSVDLPVTNVGDWEMWEGMSIVISETLTVSDNYNTGRYGEIILSADGRLESPTNVAAPGAPANTVAADNARRSIMLDDGSNLQNPSPAPYFAGDGTIRAGDTTPNLIGVVNYAFGNYRVQPTTVPVFTRVNDRPAAPPAVGGNLTVASFNVLNYFSTIDTGSPICGPNADQDCRGADTPAEFVRQRDKIFDALIDLDADIVGLMEVENNQFDDALQNLVNGVNSAAGSNLYALVNTGVIVEGDQAIKVAIIYQPATVTPLGAPALLTDAVDPTFHDYRNRVAIAQTFIENSSGQIFTVVVNHLKSKGSGCDSDVPADPDTGDGQGSCNLTRLNAITAEMNWLATDPTGSGDPDFLIIGDLNAYLLEDPIMALENGGYTNLVSLFGGSNVYSYVFFGARGLLDHAFGSANMAAQVTGTEVWHINADEPSALDYNNYNQPELYTPEKWRSSDHDPVVIGITLQTPTDVSLTGFADEGGAGLLWPGLAALALALGALVIRRRRLAA